MKTIPPLALANADLLRKADEEGRKACENLFALQAKSGASCITEQVETGRFAPEIEKIMRPLQNVERLEGLLLQTVSSLALRARRGYRVLSNQRIRVTDADRSLVASAPGAAMSDLRPPLAGTPVAYFEFDDVVFNEATGEAILVDVKRSLNDKERDFLAVKEASLSFDRLLGSRGKKSRLVVLRWYAKPRSLYGLDVATRENVDTALKAPVRNAVETALNAYREGVNARLRDHIAESLSGSAVSAFDDVVNASPNVSFEELRLILEGERQNNWRRP